MTQRRQAFGGELISAVSVISSSSRSGGRPDAARLRITVPDRSALRNCTSERLTATLMSAGHFTASAQAALSTHSPICVIRPVSSASGMNLSGKIKPLVGCRQRISASAPQIWRVLVSMIGWIMQFEFVALNARGVIRFRARAARSPVRSFPDRRSDSRCGRRIWRDRARGPPFSDSLSALVSCSGASAMPMLAPILMSMPLDVERLGEGLDDPVGQRPTRLRADWFRRIG